MNTQTLFATLTACTLVLAGCAVGPNHQSPTTVSSAQWNTPLAPELTTNQTTPPEWWQSFQDPQLNNLVQQALQANHDLRIAAARVREARAQARIASSRLLPTLDTSASYARQRHSENQPMIGELPLPPDFPFENDLFQAGFDASWELDVFGGARRTREAGQAGFAAAEYARQHAIVTLQAEVAWSYLELRGIQRRLAIAQQNLQSQQQGLDLARERFRHGLASDLDVQQAATLVANTSARIPTLEAQARVCMHRLDTLLGRPPGSLQATLAPCQPIPTPLPVVPVGLPAQLLRRRPDIRQAEQLLAAATARIGIATADLFPRFWLTGAAGFQSVSAPDWFSPSSQFWSLGPTVQWRLFDAGRIRANIKVQNARQEQALCTYEKTVLASLEEVENALTQYAQEQNRLRALNQAADSSRAALQIASQLYRAGLADFLHVLDAERSVLASEDALVQSEKTVAQNIVALYKALGGGWDPAQLEVGGAPAAQKRQQRG